MKTTLHARRIPTPLGDVFAVADAAGALVRLDFVGAGGRDADERELEARAEREGATIAWDAKRLEEVARCLGRYLAGERAALERLAIAPRGTPFQLRVWSELRRIPPGETLSYAELARRVGRPTAVRAVARANAQNPISLAVPCHRVIGSDGSLTGYAGGLGRKQALLELEGALPAPSGPRR